MAKTRLINQEMIQDLLTVDLVNETVDKTFQEFGKRRIKNPTKVTLDLGQNSDWPDYQGYMNAMPAYIGGLDVAGLKWVGGFDGGRKKAGLPYINGLILLIDPKLGTFKAVMDGTLITNLRTGAQTAVALKYIGVDRDQGIDMAIFGTGTQASNQLKSIAEWYTIKKLNVWHYHDEGVQDFIDDHQDLVEEDIHYTPDAKEACQADIIVTATKSPDPIIDLGDVEGEKIIIPIGSEQEISNRLIAAADNIVVDHVGQALHRGALSDAYNRHIIDENDIDATIGRLASGQTTLQHTKDALTICVPIGMGALDIAIAGKIYELAEDQGHGDFFEFSPY